MSPRRAKAVAGRVADDPATALREHLIDTAEQLLAQRQVSSITTRDISRAAGVSDGVLYNYFADKHELLLAALMRRYQRLADDFHTKLPEPGTDTVEANLVRFAEAAQAFHANLLPVGVGLMSEPQLLHRFLEAIHDQAHGPQHHHTRLVAYLDAERDLGRLPSGADTASAATLLQGATLLRALTGHLLHGSAQSSIKPVVSTLLKGLVGAPRGSS